MILGTTHTSIRRLEDATAAEFRNDASPLASRPQTGRRGSHAGRMASASSDLPESAAPGRVGTNTRPSVWLGLLGDVQHRGADSARAVTTSMPSGLVQVAWSSGGFVEVATGEVGHVRPR
jgi:hypothetical protein